MWAERKYNNMRNNKLVSCELKENIIIWEIINLSHVSWKKQIWSILDILSCKLKKANKEITCRVMTFQRSLAKEVSLS
jgi:hypothetical protein